MKTLRFLWSLTAGLLIWSCKDKPFVPKYFFPPAPVVTTPDTVVAPPLVWEGFVTEPRPQSVRAFPERVPLAYGLFGDLPLRLPESASYRLAGIAVGTTKDTSGVAYIRYVYDEKGLLVSRRYWDYRQSNLSAGQPYVGIQYNITLDAQNRLVREYSDAPKTDFRGFPTVDDTYTYQGNQLVAAEEKRVVGLYSSPVLYRRITYNYAANRRVGATIFSHYDPVAFASMPTPVTVTKRTISYLNEERTVIETDTTPPFPNTTELRLARVERTFDDKGYLLRRSGTNTDYWTNVQFTYAYNGPDGLLSRRTEVVNGLVYRFLYEKK